MSRVERSTRRARGADTLRMHRRGHRRSRPAVALWLSVAALLVGAVLAGGSGALEQPPAPSEQVPPPANPATVPGYGHDPVSLLGPTRLTPAQMAAYANSIGHPRASVPIAQLAVIYLQEGAALGVRADIAWAAVDHRDRRLLLPRSWAGAPARQQLRRHRRVRLVPLRPSIPERADRRARARCNCCAATPTRTPCRMR